MILDNSDNVFGYSGFLGYGPGNHTSKERFSYTAISDFFLKLNTISYLLRFNSSLENSFVGMFYGLIDLTYSDGTVFGALTENVSNYGIPLKQSVVLWDNTDDSFLEIPIDEEMIVDKLTPTCVFHLYDTSSPVILKYIPQFQGTSFSMNKVIRVSFIDIEEQNLVDSTFFQNIGRFKLSVFGYCIYNREDL